MTIFNENPLTNANVTVAILVCDNVIIILAVTPACRHAPEKMSQIGCNAGMVTCTGTRPQNWDLKNAHFEMRESLPSHKSVVIALVCLGAGSRTA